MNKMNQTFSPTPKPSLGNRAALANNFLNLQSGLISASSTSPSHAHLHKFVKSMEESKETAINSINEGIEVIGMLKNNAK